MPVAPNRVILLTMDALRADHLSCYGYSRRTTQTVDELAADSLRFTQAYSASSHTREAIPALITGEYPDVAVDETYRLKTDSIASTLSETGFKTASFHSNPFISRAFGFNRGFDTFDDDLYLGRNRLIALAQRALDKLRNRHFARAEAINDRALAWIDSLAADDSFFLWNHYMDSHGPYEPPERYRSMYHDESVTDSEAQSLYQRAIRNPDSITDVERRRLVDLYDGEIRYADAEIGSFLDSLRDRGLFEDSLLVFTADHGDAFGEHGYFEHPRYLHGEVTHVPLLVRPPGGTDRVDVSTPVSTLDVVPTIERAVGTDDATKRTLLDPPTGDRPVFLQARGEGEESHLRRFALRTRTEACFCEYDSRTGDVEYTRCTDDGLLDELRAHVDDRLQHEDDDAEGTSGEDDAVDDEIERRLSALGYRE